MEPVVMYMDEYLEVWAGNADRYDEDAYVVGHGHMDKEGVVTMFIYGPGPDKETSARPVDVNWAPPDEVPF